jgi:large subunit ribosomal protein L25
MEHRLLNAQIRKETTKGELRSLRVSGKIPGVMYGGGKDATRLFLDAVEFKKTSHGLSESTIFNLSLDGKISEVFIKEHQRDVLSGHIIHVDFLELVSGRAIHARVPIKLVGSSIGVRNGGILENPAHEIEVECDPRYLPEHISVDIANLEANHSIHVRDLPVLEHVRVLSSRDLVVALVKFAKAEVVVEAAPVAAAATPATPAAGAAAAPATAAEKEKK